MLTLSVKIGSSSTESPRFCPSFWLSIAAVGAEVSSEEQEMFVQATWRWRRRWRWKASDWKISGRVPSERGECNLSGHAAINPLYCLFRSFHPSLSPRLSGLPLDTTRSEGLCGVGKPRLLRLHCWSAVSLTAGINVT